ncbi:MAG: alkaline phosphatase family protein [Thermoproteus sp.]
MERPDYEGGGINSLPNALLAHFGLPQRGPPPRFQLGLSGRRVALVLLDGLGFDLFVKAAGDAAVRGVYKLTSVFPTTTATVLTTLSTGLAPCQHGVVAWSFYMKEAGSIVDALQMSPIFGGRDGLNEAGYDLKSLFYAPTIFADLSRAGVKSRAFLPRGLGGGISRILYEGAEVFEYVSMYDAIINAGRFLQQNDAAYAYIYISTIDSAAHRYGPKSEEVLATARGVLEEVLRLAGRYMKDVEVLITADHGHEEIAKSENLTGDLELLRALDVPPYGDPRALHLKTSRGAEGAREALRRRGDFLFLTREEAVKAGLFGPCDGRFEERLGDLLALPPRGVAALYMFKPKNEEPLKFRGHHGGLSEDELYVPLVIA